MLFHVKFYIRLSVLIFLLTICSLTGPLNVFGLSFLKKNTRSAFYGPLQCKLYLQFSNQNGCLFPVSRPSISMFPYLASVFVHVTYTICIINVFHDVNLTLLTVISIHNIQEMNQY